MLRRVIFHPFSFDLMDDKVSWPDLQKDDGQQVHYIAWSPSSAQSMICSYVNYICVTPSIRNSTSDVVLVWNL